MLLVVDQESVVGARLGSNAEVGFLRGRGEIDGDGRLDLDLVDDSETPGKDDVVVTWGSRSGAPYVAGVPIGTVDAVFSSPREQSKHAVITPFVDFSSLDLVGVVVDADTEGDRPVIRAGEVRRGGPLMPVVRAALFTVLLLAAVVLQVALLLLLLVRRRGAQPGAARRGGRRADPRPGVRRRARLRRRAGHRPRPAGRPRRRPLGAGARGRRLPRRPGPPGRRPLGPRRRWPPSPPRSFVGTSVFALSGLLLREPVGPAGEALRVIPTALLYDLLLAPFVLPLGDADVPAHAAAQVAY